ncbi:hypothetical protein Tco_0954722 [Tanacetum coccineum]|uniref:Zinc finger, CCHC-type n=1 Tax=Tanacetum coccineum TaxID=301880 RepID=A0ABQ5E566_9ASTR
MIWAPTTNNLKKDYIGCCAMKLIDNIQTKSFNTFAKLDKFEGVDFRRWQKKMHFLLSSMSVVYVLTTPILEDGGDDATVEQIRKRAKWDNDDYVCRGRQKLLVGNVGKLVTLNGLQWFLMLATKPMVQPKGSMVVLRISLKVRTMSRLKCGSILHGKWIQQSLVQGSGYVDISVVYVLTTPIPEYSENATVHQIKRRNKWDSDDYVCRGLTLKGMSDPLFNIYQNIESRKEL